MEIPQKQASKLNLARTPGGNNFYGSTPGGTRIVYSKGDLLSLASSPLSKTPPTGAFATILQHHIYLTRFSIGLSNFPAAMSRSDHKNDSTKQKPSQREQPKANNDDTTFEMDD